MEGEEGEKASLPVFLSSLLGLGVGRQTPWLLLRTSLSFSFTGKYSSKFLAHQVLSWHWFLEDLKIHIFNIIIKFTLFSPFSGCQIVCCLDLSFNPLKSQEILAEFCKQCPQEEAEVSLGDMGRPCVKQNNMTTRNRQQNPRNHPSLEEGHHLKGSRLQSYHMKNILFCFSYAAHGH